MVAGGQAISDILAGIVPAERTVKVCLRGDLPEQVEEAKKRWLEAVVHDENHNEASTAAPIVAEIEALEAEAEAATVAFRLVAVGARAWRALVAAHEPAPDEEFIWDPVTFPPAALAATCADPVMTEDQAGELADHLSNGQWMKLWAGVFAANAGDDMVPKSAFGTVAPQSSGPRSTTADPEESPEGSL